MRSSPLPNDPFKGYHSTIGSRSFNNGFYNQPFGDFIKSEYSVPGLFYTHPFSGNGYVDISGSSYGKKNLNDGSFEKGGGSTGEKVRKINGGYRNDNNVLKNSKGEYGAYYDNEGGQNRDKAEKAYLDNKNQKEEGG